MSEISVRAFAQISCPSRSKRKSAGLSSAFYYRLTLLQHNLLGSIGLSVFHKLIQPGRGFPQHM